jgi:hypothetical protein
MNCGEGVAGVPRSPIAGEEEGTRYSGGPVEGGGGRRRVLAALLRILIFIPRNTGIFSMVRCPFWEDLATARTVTWMRPQGGRHTVGP